MYAHARSGEEVETGLGGGEVAACRLEHEGVEVTVVPEKMDANGAVFRQSAHGRIAATPSKPSTSKRLLIEK